MTDGCIVNDFGAGQRHMACSHCDLLLETVKLSAGERSVCPRCNHILYYDSKAFGVSLAFILTALILYFPSILLPFLSMQTVGQIQDITLLSSVVEIATGEMILLATTVFLLVILLPLIKFVGLLLIIIPLSLQKSPPLNKRMIHWILQLGSWSMVEVYLIGVIVALVKLTGMANIDFMNGFYIFVLLMIVDTIVSLTLPKQYIWQHIRVLTYSQYDSSVQND
ncbi:MAG: paraquat-inducible protein A [Ostreibacterium sp.]